MNNGPQASRPEQKTHGIKQSVDTRCARYLGQLYLQALRKFPRDLKHTERSEKKLFLVTRLPETHTRFHKERRDFSTTGLSQAMSPILEISDENSSSLVPLRI